jgi:hypothetical protein
MVWGLRGVTRLLSCLLQASLSVPESTSAPQPLTAIANARPGSQAGPGGHAQSVSQSRLQGLGSDIRSVETATPWSRMAAAISPSPALVMPTSLSHASGSGVVAAPSALSLSLAHRAHYLTTGNLPSLFASFAGTSSIAPAASSGDRSGPRAADDEVHASTAGTTLFPDTPLASHASTGAGSASLAQRSSAFVNMSPIVRAGMGRAV